MRQLTCKLRLRAPIGMLAVLRAKQAKQDYITSVREFPSLTVYRFGFALSYSGVSSRRRHASSVDLRAVPPQERRASRQPLAGHALHGLSSVRPITQAWNGLTPTRLVVAPAPGAQRHGGHHEQVPDGDVASVHTPSLDRGRRSGRRSSVRRGTQVLGRSGARDGCRLCGARSARARVQSRRAQIAALDREEKTVGRRAPRTCAHQRLNARRALRP